MFVNKAKIVTVALISVLFVISSSLAADDVSDAINDALKAYSSKDELRTSDSLNRALSLLNARKARELDAVLPKPFEGWSVENAARLASAAQRLFGGAGTAKKYHKGDTTITLHVVGGSSMADRFKALVSDGKAAQSVGGELVGIGGHKAMSTYNPDSRNGEINVVVGERYFISVSGTRVNKIDLLAYAKAIDYKLLVALP